MIGIVSATRLGEAEFWRTSALGISLRRLAFDRRLVACVAFLNQRGLPEIYNAQITASSGPELLMFVHDDVWIDDHHLSARLVEALNAFDVVGVAGNRHRHSRQPAWAFVDETFSWDANENLSGAVAHGASPFGPVSFFGEAPAPCELLDGVFLAARKSSLLQAGVRFDERFKFHFYDMDFCRTARAAGLRLGTWPIALTHQSGGAFGSPAWSSGYRDYLGKWGS